MPIHTLESFISVELEIFGAWWKPSIMYQELWSMTMEHYEYFWCKPEFEPIIRFCLMWATTMAQPTVYDHLDFIGERRSNISSWFNEDVKLKILSNKVPENYIYVYDSRKENNRINPQIRFSFKFEKNTTLNFGRILIDAFRDTVPTDIDDAPCRMFMKPYNLKWIKDKEPYRLALIE